MTKFNRQIAGYYFLALCRVQGFALTQGITERVFGYDCLIYPTEICNLNSGNCSVSMRIKPLYCAKDLGPSQQVQIAWLSVFMTLRKCKFFVYYLQSLLYCNFPLGLFTALSFLY